MATKFEELMVDIMKEVDNGKNTNRYNDFLSYVEGSRDLTDEQKIQYVDNFNTIFNALCESITRKALAKANSGLERNTQYITVLRTLKYNLSEIATSKLSEGKAVTFYTDSVKGPQGDLLVAMKDIANIKNFIPNLAGVKLPQADPTVNQIEDKFTLGRLYGFVPDNAKVARGFQQFIALDSHGEMQTIIEYNADLQERLTDQYTGEDQNFASNLQVEDAFMYFKSLVETSAKQNGIQLVSQEYLDRYKFAQAKFLETLYSKMDTEGNFAFCFEQGKPVGDLKEALKGTMFDNELYKTVFVPLMLKWKEPGSIDGYEYTMGADGFKGKPSESQTFALMFTKDKLTREPIRPYKFGTAGKTRLTDKEYREDKYRALTESTDKECALRLFEQGYTEEQVDAMAKKVFDIQRGRYSTPVLKKPLVKVQKTAKDFKSTKITKVEPAKSVVGTERKIFIPVKTIEYTMQSVKGVRLTNRKDDTKIIAKSMAEARKVSFENYLGGKVDGIEEVAESVALQTAFRMQFEGDVGAYDVYESVIKDSIYKSAKEAIENNSELVLKMGANGAEGTLKQIIEQSSKETTSVCPNFLGADPRKITKVFVSGENQENIDANKITISKDGVVAENVPTQDDDRAQ